MIGISEGGRQAINTLCNIRIIPPGEWIGTESLDQADDGEKCGYSDYEVDKLTELGACPDGVNSEIEDG